MTLAPAAACSEGVVLITDSMQIHSTLNLLTGEEVEHGVVAPGKITQLSKAGLIYIYSGNCTVDVEDFAADGFEAAVRALWKEHRQFSDEHPATHWRLDQAMRAPEGSVERVEGLREAAFCDVLAASLSPDADGPRMALITSEGERWIGTDGGLLVAGAAAPWWATESASWPTPHSLLECQATALAVTSAYHWFSYQRLGRTFAGLQREIEATGKAMAPSVAQPYRGATISRLGVRRWRCVLPADEELYVVGLERDEAPAVTRPMPSVPQSAADRRHLVQAEAKRQRRATGRAQRIPTGVR